STSPAAPTSGRSRGFRDVWSLAYPTGQRCTSSVVRFIETASSGGSFRVRGGWCTTHWSEVEARVGARRSTTLVVPCYDGRIVRLASVRSASDRSVPARLVAERSACERLACVRFARA